MSMRTRHQRLLAEQAGEAPSPPRALITEPRPKRTRAQRSTAQASPSQAQPATQPPSAAQQQTSRSMRTGRTSQRTRARGGRRAAQSDANAHSALQEGSDASTHHDASAQSDSSTQVAQELSHASEEVKGETPASHLGSATRPVSATRGSPKNANAQANVGVSRATLGVHPVRTNRVLSPSSIATSPVFAVSGDQLSTPEAQPVQDRRSPSKTSLLLAQMLSSPVTLGTNLGPDHSTDDIPGLALVESTDTSPVSFPDKSALRVSSAAKIHAPSHLTIHADPSGPMLRLPGPGNVQRALPMFRPGMPQTSGVPSVREKPYSLMTVFVDAHPPTCGPQPPANLGESIALSIPTETLPLIMLLASKVNPELDDFRENDPVAARIFKESRLNQDLHIEMSLEPQVIDRKRKRRTYDDEAASADATNGSPRVFVNKKQKPIVNSRSIGVMRKHFVRMATESKRAALEEAANPPGKRVRTILKTVPDLYDEDGNLTLGREKQITVDVDESGREVPRSRSPETPFDENQPDETREIGGHRQPAQEQIPQTPRTRGWGLTSMIPSSVAKYLPFTTTRSPSTAVQTPTVGPDPHAIALPSETNKPTFNTSATPAEIHHPTGNNIPSTPQQTDPFEAFRRRREQRSQLTQRPREVYREVSEDLSVPNTTGGLAKRNHTEKPKKRLLTKAQQADWEKLKKAKEELRVEKARLEQEKKEFEEHRTRIEATQAPGTKRKRVPSPEVIPLPPGGGFGLHPDFFTYDSSDEEGSEEEPDTPTKRPAKKARVISRSPATTSISRGASLFEGEHFALADPPPENSDASVFREETPAITHEYSPANSQQDTQSTSASTKPDNTTYTPSAPAGKFAVPSPGDSDDEEEVEELRDPLQGEDETKSKQVWTWVDPVEKARSKALRFQPKLGSRLRESSRISSPKLSSGATNEPTSRVEETNETDAGYDDSQYDPRRHGLLPPFNTVERSTSSGAAKPIHDGVGKASRNDQASNVSKQKGAGQPTSEDQSRFVTPDTTSAVKRPNKKEQPAPTTSEGVLGIGEASSQNQITRGTLPSTVNNEQPIATAELGTERAYEGYRNEMSVKIQEYLRLEWDLFMDQEATIEEFEDEFAEYKQQESSEAGGNPSPTSSDGTSRNQALYERANVSPGVQALIEANYTQDDEDDEDDSESELDPSTFEETHIKPNVRVLLQNGGNVTDDELDPAYQKWKAGEEREEQEALLEQELNKWIDIEEIEEAVEEEMRHSLSAPRIVA